METMMNYLKSGGIAKMSEILKREVSTEIVGMYYRRMIKITLSAGIISIKSYTFDPITGDVINNDPIRTEFVKDEEESKDAK